MADRPGGGKMGRISRWAVVLVSATITAVALPLSAAEKDSPDYKTDVAPIFQKYCTACHSSDEPEGGLNLETYAGLKRGGENGAVLDAAQFEKSRLLLVLTKQAEPFMPPDGSEGPNEQELAILAAWIKAGARGPQSDGPLPRKLVTPRIDPVGEVREPISALSWSPDGKWLAVARYGYVELFSGPGRKPFERLEGPSGHVNDVGFSADGSLLFAAAGEAGLFGEVTLWNTADWTVQRTIRGHRDSLYAADMSPDGTQLATAGYDQEIILWNVATGKELRTFTGHNGPVFDVAFHPGGRLLASASGDRTVKLWDVAKGERLDTLVEPTKEQYALAFHPSGRYLAAGGVDNRIRVWELTQSGQEGTNPIRYSRFAHEGPIIELAYSPNGNVLISSSEDRTLKLWETRGYTQRRMLDKQSDWASAVGLSPDRGTLLVGRLDGTLQTYKIDASAGDGSRHATPVTALPIPKPHGEASSEALAKTAEIEPNDRADAATPIPVPGTASGILRACAGASQDVDLYRFESKSGQTWIIETDAARQKSPADTKIEVLHADGSPVLRLLLRAVRDSYITFRPINSNQTAVRIENWEEMELNQFCYMGGEVGKFYRMPQGPDSGMELYKVNGKRKCYFETSATIHAKGDPIYIVEPHWPGTKLTDNGLPVFPLYYANDDDGDRKLGTDSQLTFTAPDDGAYLVRVTDVRGFSGNDFKYSLTVREPRPDFQVTIDGKGPTLSAGSGQRLTVKVDRIDGFNDEVRVDFKNLPDGLTVATPVVVEAGHVEAQTVLYADPDVKAPEKEAWSQIQVTAAATIHGKEIKKDLGDLGEIKLGKEPKLRVSLEPDVATGTEPPQEIVMAPGTTITAMIRIERSEGFDGEIKFDVDNLPHGVIVDNIGLSGVLIRQGEDRRQIFLTAADWVPETARWIHAVAKGHGNQASRPIRFRIQRPGEVAQVK